MAAPLVSAIIAVYNGEECVARAIDSVLAQQFGSFELIVVDDASRDSTPKVLARYGDRIRVIRRKRNRGLAAARNHAVDHVQGGYVAFLDADDVWLPGRLAKTVEVLQSHPTATLAFSDVVPVGDGGVPLAPTYLHPGAARSPLMEELLEEGWWPILPSTVTIRRWVFDRVGGFAEEYKGASGFEDTELWFLLRELGDFAFVPEPLVNYRLSPMVGRMRKYAPGFGLFAERMRKRYGEAGARLARRSAALYHWLLTVKGLRCLEAGEMREARRALFCALRYQPDLTPPGLSDQLHAVFENGSAADLNGRAPTTGRHDVLRAWYALLPHRRALEAMRRKGLLEIPPPPSSHAGFAEELLAGRVPLAIY
ncbi:MAG TPA: glycosyltransferase family 2 protein [Candidatus Binataceae bacterium]|jgi:glycosyltransferase involved in cell wall biosynthesis|nr:glycosyltransferase family 2 protein [Candidatus Binataceae bacterium]